MEDSIFSVGFDIVTEEASSQEDRRVGFYLFIERETNEENWTIGFSSITENVSNQEDLRAGYSLVTEEETSKEEWSATMVVDPVRETELLPRWETQL
jgi:hypothetical protein